MQTAVSPPTPIRIDIVSDVVCPWCVVGYKQLEAALAEAGPTVTATVYWHPFELNPDMPPEGQNQREYIMLKYGSTPAQSEAARRRLTAAGAAFGFQFAYTDDMRVWNSFKAHQLLRWARQQGRDTELKLALFETYFTRREKLDDDAVLMDTVARTGLDRVEAAAVLADGRFGDAVRTEERHWIAMGIQGVPAVIFQGRYILSGAQGVKAFGDVLKELTKPTGLPIASGP